MLRAQEVEEMIITSSDTTYYLTENDLKKGERLFYGLMRDQQDQQSCVSCHNILPTDTFNWNPSAFDIAAMYRERSLEDFKQVILNPRGNKMAEVHADYQQLGETELIQLKGYLVAFYEKGGEKAGAVINNWIYFFGLLAVLILTVLDLSWFKTIKVTAVHSIVILATSTLLTVFVVKQAIALGRSRDYQPDQPIKFSHLVHAGANQIDCQYCHYGAEDTKSAGIMGISNCLNCHMIVREGSRSGTFEIDKIFIALDTLQQSVEWVRIHNLPDHVFFNHAQHVAAGMLECEECHGKVEEMNAIYQFADLSMGWCLDCHRTRSVQFTENEYYTGIYTGLGDELASGRMDSVLVEDIGGTDCMRCHY